MDINLYNDDCLNVLKNIGSESIDCVVTDCPYKIIAGGVRVVYDPNECRGVLNKRDYSQTDPKGVLNRGKKVVLSDGTECSNKWVPKETNNPSAVKDGKMFDNNEIKFSEWLPELYRVLKKGTHCYIMINGRNLKDLQIEAEKVGFEYQNLLIWHKKNYTPNKYYMQGCEFILMLSKRPARNINNMGEKNLFEIPNIIGKKKHPTEKPISLMEILIRNSTNIGEIVLDPFCGAGSTMMACKKLERKGIGIEIDKQYYDIMINRLSTESIQTDLF